MAKLDGNTHVGYFTEKGCFCLDCVTDENYGHTEDEVSEGIQDGSIQEVMDEDYNNSEACKVCGWNLIEKAFPEPFSYHYDAQVNKFWILKNSKPYAPKGKKWFAKSEKAAQKYVEQLTKGEE